MHLLLQAQAILTKLFEFLVIQGLYDKQLSPHAVGKKLLGTMGDEPVNGAFPMYRKDGMPYEIKTFKKS